MSLLQTNCSCFFIFFVTEYYSRTNTTTSDIRDHLYTISNHLGTALFKRFAIVQVSKELISKYVEERDIIKVKKYNI